MWYDLKDLIDMLEYPRNHDSPMEAEFIKKYIDSIRGMKKDGFGNRYIKSGNSDVAFLSHLDTVHSQIDSTRKQDVMVSDGFAFKENNDDWQAHKNKGKKKKGKKVNTYTSYGGMYGYNDFSNQQYFNRSPLGGDDTAGVWLMLNLLHSGVPGLYIFFRSEERGSQGSHYMERNEPNILAGINKAVALDRRDYFDVITHQGGTRTCSDKFAKAIANQLGGGYKPCSGGIHCDSANLTYLIPECTNISVGYFQEHTSNEILDLDFIEKLFHKLKGVHWNSLPVDKVVEKKEFAQKNLYNSWDSAWSWNQADNVATKYGGTKDDKWWNDYW
jgi:hypothetical protein